MTSSSAMGETWHTTYSGASLKGQRSPSLEFCFLGLYLESSAYVGKEHRLGKCQEKAVTDLLGPNSIQKSLLQIHWIFVIQNCMWSDKQAGRCIIGWSTFVFPCFPRVSVSCHPSSCCRCLPEKLRQLSTPLRALSSYLIPAHIPGLYILAHFRHPTWHAS